MLIEDLRKLSASADEYILPFPQVLEAIELWRKNNIACIGWELILRHPDGNIGHPVEVIGLDAGIGENEAYDDFVERSSWDCKCTIEETVKENDEKYKEKGIELLFCVIPSDET